MGLTPDGALGPLPRVRAVCFDLDNTLVDVIHLKRRAAQAAAWALADAGMDINPEKAARAIHAIAIELGIDRHDIVDHYVTRKLGQPCLSLTAVGRHAYERAEDAHTVPYPRAHGTLLELTRRGYALALITDAPRHRAIRRLQAASLTPFFNHIVTLEDTGDGKVTERPYALMCQRLGTNQDEVVMVGDNPRLDVGTARGFGARTVLARYGVQEIFKSDAPEHQPDYSIDWLDELLHILPQRTPALSETAINSPAQDTRRVGEARA